MIYNPDKWTKYRRNPFYYSRLYPMFIGAIEHFSDYFSVPFGTHVYYGNDRVLEWYYDRKWTLRLGDHLIEILAKNGQLARLFRKNWRLLYRAVCRLSDKIIFKTDFKKLSDKEIKQALLQWHELAKRFHCLTVYAIDMLDESLLIRMRDELKKKIKDQTIFEKTFEVFNTPTEATYIQKRDFEVFKLATRIKRRGGKIDWADYEKEIKKIADRFWWTPLGWMPNYRFSEKDIKKEILKNIRGDFNNKFKYLNDFSRGIESRKKEELKRLKLGKRFIDLLKVFEKLAIYHDQRKEGQVRLVEAGDAIMREIVRRRKGLKFTDIAHLNVDEVIAYFEGKNFKVLIKEREKYSICYLHKGKFIALDGYEALVLRNKIIGEDRYFEIKEFKGMSASSGRARGKVRVSNNPIYLKNNLKLGEILVTTQTTPDFVPVMKKAQAIITDEGGATCHAAIISRELKIPCIVGTKIATDVLKDGDLVEVDANKGIVKILKN